MRIAINGWFWERFDTGSGQYLAQLLAWLPQVGPGHQWVLVVPWLDRDRPGTDGLIPPGWQVRQLPALFGGASRNLAKVWFEQVAFPRACRQLQADVALVPYWGSPWWRPCPMMVTVHDLIPLLLPLYRGGLLQRLYTSLVSLTARRATAILTDSEAARRDILAHLHVPAQRVYAVHLGAERQLRPLSDQEELARVRAKYRLPEEPFLLYLGGFDARKNVARMIAAYAGLARMSEDASSGGLCGTAKLVVAGKLPEQDSAFAPDPRPLAAQLGVMDRVFFIGRVDEADKPALYSLARGALYLSEYEGFGLQVLEAMSCGCPLIVSNQPDG